MLWAVARASLQTIIGDESDTYVLYVARACCTHWMPSANNHVLNTMLMRLFTDLFGASHLTVRMPALIGAAFYVGAAHRLVRWLTEEKLAQWIIFACLVLNPFVFDYLVAARGYGMASAFLLCAIVAAATSQNTVRGAAWMSAFLGLSFAANFSFAIIDTLAFVLLSAWLFARSESKVRTLTGALLPGLSVTLLLSAWNLLNWPKDQLGDGVESMGELLRSVLQSTLYQVNPALISPLLMHTVTRFGRLGLTALAILAVVRIAFLLRNRTSAYRPLKTMAALIGTAIGLALIGHWLLFRLYHVLLPHDRTALWLAVLCTLLAGTLAAIPAITALDGWCRRGLLATLGILALYFVACLRLTYFREWEWGAEAKEAYWTIAYYNHTRCIDDVASSWLYIGSLNYYRTVSGRESFGFFNDVKPYPEDRAVYVLHSELDHEFMEKEKLKVVFHGRRTQIVVAVRPDLLEAKTCTPRP